MDANTHHSRAEEMMAAAESADLQESAAGQVYATVAVAEALLALQATLDGVREEIRSLKIRS